jgi:hypothetical protein
MMPTIILKWYETLKAFKRFSRLAVKYQDSTRKNIAKFKILDPST